MCPGAGQEPSAATRLGPPAGAGGGPPADAASGDREAATPNLLRRAGTSGGPGVLHDIDPDSAGWRYVSFAARRLAAGDAIDLPATDEERLVLPLEGHARVTVGDTDFGGLGSRTSVFDGPPPPVVLAAPGSRVNVTAEDDLLLVVAAAPGGPAQRTACVAPADVLVEHRGEGDTARRIHHLLPPASVAGRLIAFEVFTPGGNWSSWPPHKHDTENPPVESQLEELYFYRFALPSGFAFQRVYTPERDLDVSLTPGDGDVVLVPRGYHPVGAPAGYDCYYLNVMAGPTRAWHFTVDPDHAWQMNWDPAAPVAAAEEVPK